MQLLADENVPGPVVFALRAAGHDVEWIYEDARGSADRDLLFRARATQRYLLTFDQDFGALIFRDRLPPPIGVILVRLAADLNWNNMADLVVSAFESSPDWSGTFVVLDEQRLRLAPLPPALPGAGDVDNS